MLEHNINSVLHFVLHLELILKLKKGKKWD